MSRNLYENHKLLSAIFQNNLGPVEVLLVPLILVECGPLHHRQMTIRDDQRYCAKHHLNIRMMMMLMLLVNMLIMMMMMLLMIMKIRMTGIRVTSFV